MSQEELPVIARFVVHRRAYLAPDGAILRDLPDFAAEQAAQRGESQSRPVRRLPALQPRGMLFANSDDGNFNITIAETIKLCGTQ